MSCFPFKKKNKRPEDILQEGAEKFLQLNNIPYIHIPNDVYRLIFGDKSSRNIGAKARVSKAIKSVPDLLIFKKDGDKHNKDLLIELKTPKGKLTEGQKQFKEKLNVLVLRKLGDVIDEINEFMDS